MNIKVDPQKIVRAVRVYDFCKRVHTAAKPVIETYKIKKAASELFTIVIEELKRKGL